MNTLSVKRKLRSMLACVLCAVMLLTGIPIAVSAAGASETATKSGELLLATISDTHYFPAALSPHKDDASYDAFLETMLTSNLNYETQDYLLETAFSSLEAAAVTKGLKYVVLSGDLTLNGEKQGHEALAEKLRTFEDRTGLKVFVANGNHDINNSKAASYSNTPVEITSPQDFMEIYYDFGFADAYHTFIDYKDVADKQTLQSKAGMLSYSVQLDDGYRLIMLDAGHYSADVTEDGMDEHETSGGVTKESYAWLLAEIEDAKQNGETPILVTHWNLSGINYLHEYVLSGFVIDEHYKLQEELADAGLHYAFTGHEHVSDIDITYSDKGEVMYSIITPTLTEFPAAYRLTKISYDKQSGAYTADFNTCEANGKKTKELSVAYTGELPYSITVFKNQFANADSTTYLMRLLRNFVIPYSADIVAAGGIIPFVEKLMEIDISALLDELLRGGIVFGDFELFTAKNIMAFLDDLDGQITKLLLAEPEKTCDEILLPAVEELVSLQISEVPCTKFINTIGFGSADKGGTLADMFMSVMYYMYEGNEDISDDPFVQDVLVQMQSGALVKPIIEQIREVVVNDIILDMLLANLNVNLTTLFVNSELNVIPEFDTFNSLYYIIVSFIDSGFFDYLMNGEEITFQGVMVALLHAVMDVLDFNTDTSYKHLLDIVLDLANLDYGSTTDEVIDNLLGEYVYTDTMIDGVSYGLYQIVAGCVLDDDKDNNVTYVYNGPIEVTPTQDEMQLPAMFNMTFGTDSTTAYNLNWYTKYNVSGTDIELYEADGAPAFTGKTVLPGGVHAKYITTGETRAFNGVDIGIFGIMSVERDVYRHVIELTNLKPATTYAYRVGDAELGYWSETGTFTTASGEDDAFTFFHFTDTQSITPDQYDVWGKLLDDAVALYPDSAFIAHTGDFVDHGDGFMQWKWGLNAASENLANMAIMPTAGNHEAMGTYALDNYFHISEGSMAIPQYTDVGIYYSYDYNNAHFIVLNTNSINEDGTLNAAQVRWLQKDVEEASDADWLILQMHKSIFSQGSHYGEDEMVALREQLLKLMIDLDIDLVLAGHDHIYMRTPSLGHYGLSPKTETVTITGKDGVEYTAVCDPEGSVFVCGGSSGVKKYVPEELGATIEYFSNSYYAYPTSDEEQIQTPMFSAITIDGTTLTFAAYTYDENGALQLFDKTAISKTKIIYMTGDSDADGVFEAEDARTALRLSVGLDWSTVSDLTLMAADFNCDGKIQADDARRILRCSVGYSDDLSMVETKSVFKGEFDSRYE